MDEIEGHPIPQDITGFQFRLIGDMTIKQFAYLAGAAVLAWFFFSLPMPLVLRLPLAGGFAILGIIFAFMPISGRPADTMIILFFRAMFKPNQFAKKSLLGAEPQTQTVQIKPVQKTVKDLAIKNEPVDATSVQPPTQNIPTLNISLQNPNATEIIMKEDKEQVLQQELQKAMTQRTELENKLKEMEAKLNQQVAIPTPPPISPSHAPSYIRELPSSPKPPISIPLVPTDAPNLVYGVIKDPRDNMLPNILVEVKDQDGNPVRAFKTNVLGQFASATSLSNGIYTITFDDPKKKQQFTPIELSATGDVLPPLIIVSIDEREQLRKTLFASKS